MSDVEEDNRHTSRQMRGKGRARAIVFAGPPLSWKTALSQEIADQLRLRRYAMDEIRVRIIPDSAHGRQDRAASYRTMFLLAEDRLAAGESVILDATFTSRWHRMELASVVSRVGAGFMLVECQVEPTTARSRLAARSPGHPATDLTADSVAREAAAYPFSGLGLVVRTERSFSQCLSACAEYVNTGSATDPFAWSETAEPPPLDEGEERHGGKRLTPISRSRARLVALAMIAVGISTLVFALLSVLAWWCQVQDWSSVATFWMSLSILSAAVLPLFQWALPRFVEAAKIVSVGDVPRYAPFHDTRPTDAALWLEYQLRCQEKRGFLIDEVPIYFIVPPSPGVLYDMKVEVDSSETLYEADYLSERAARLGLDWYGFRNWREAERRKEYRNWVESRGMRLIGVKREDESMTVVAKIAPVRYTDYLVTELSVNLSGNPAFPIDGMRALFEGEDWGALNVNLEDVPGAGRYYSMMIGVQTLVCTKDNFLVLHRRSNLISEGAGRLSSSAGGSTDWDRDGASRPGAIERAALRELYEEIGIPKIEHGWSSKGIQLPQDGRVFMGAAFNLLHGRDINFYCFLRSNVSHDEVSVFRGGRRWWNPISRQACDNWEVASLAFVPADSVGVGGLLTGDFAAWNRYCNRHLRGLLYAYSVAVRRLSPPTCR